MDRLGTLETGMVARLRDGRVIKIVDVTRERVVGHLRGKIRINYMHYNNIPLKKFVEVPLSEIAEVQDIST